MTLTQSWVGYLDRSYEQIKKSILNRLGVTAPEITDHSESNPLIVLVGLFSGIAEVIHLYLDYNARESFIGTARRYDSVVKLARLVDYNVKARAYATADLQFSLVDSNTNIGVPAPGNIAIPINTLIYPKNSQIPFRTLRTVTLPTDFSSLYVPVGQFTQIAPEALGSSLGGPNQRFPISPKYVDASGIVTVGGVAWALYTSFAQMGPNTKGAVIEIDEEGLGWLVFGDNIHGKIPTALQVIALKYKSTEGVLGNLPPGSITELQDALLTPVGTKWLITNNDYSSNGTDFETIEDVRQRAPRSIRTLERAVTYQDYIDLAMLVPGVGAAEVKYCCGKYVDVYITPSSFGTATSALTQRVKNYMDERAMITTIINARPSGSTLILITANVFGKPLETEDDIKAQVVQALDANFGIGTIQINRRVSVTDIITVVENLSKVDTIEISQVRIQPYPRASVTTNSVLNILWTTLPHTTERATWTVIYKSATNNFQIYKNGVFIQLLDLTIDFNDAGRIVFNIQAGTYTNNDKWEFVVYPSYPEIFPETIIEIDDYSAPIIAVTQFINEETEQEVFGDFTYTEQSSSPKILAPCEGDGG